MSINNPPQDMGRG